MLHGSGLSGSLSVYNLIYAILDSHESLIPHLHSMPNLAPVFLSYKKTLLVMINLDHNL